MSKAIKKAVTPRSFKRTLLGGLAGDPQGLILGDKTVDKLADPAGLGKLLKKPGETAAVAATETAVMPTPNDAAAMAARRRRMLQSQARSGRQSTLLSTMDTLG